MRRLHAAAVVGLMHIACLSLADPPVPDGVRLRELVARNFPDGNVFIGGTTGWRKRARGSGIVLDREFSYVTPENDFKQTVVHPRPDVWNWEFADAWLEDCSTSGQVLRIHGPISPQCSKWAMDDSRTGDELRGMLEEYMTALCQHCNEHDCVKWLDVVNETVLPNGEWHGPKPGTDKWENPWPTIGFDENHPLKPPLYIKLAFEIANRHAPNIGLIINQNGSMQVPMWNTVKATVNYLRDQGLRVDGIGWQAHVTVGWEKTEGNLERLHNLIAWAHANALSFHVTENNVWLKQKKDYDAQAVTFAEIVRALLEHRHTGIVTWNVWNISDRDQWARTRAWNGCIFDDTFNPKPAYYAIQQLLTSPPSVRQAPRP